MELKTVLSVFGFLSCCTHNNRIVSHTRNPSGGDISKTNVNLHWHLLSVSYT